VGNIMNTVQDRKAMNTVQDRRALRRPASPLRLERPRTLWVMRDVSGKLVTAAIYHVGTGLKLRINYGTHGDVLDAMISKVSAVPLLERAEGVRRILDAQGWRPVAVN
jgi:hypothetical protein